MTSSVTHHTDPFEPLNRAGLIAVIRATRPQEAVQIAGALLKGGVPAVELTFSTPGAAEALAEVRQTYGDDVLVGAGTIREPAQVEEAVQAGAAFLVTAHLRSDVLKAMLATGLPVAPGVFTPSEVAQALDAGAQAIKLFPASTGGPRHLRALCGPFPELRAIPTGGIGIEDLAAWFAAGALAVGIGSELAPRELVRGGHWQEITRLAERFTAACRTARETNASREGAAAP
jgi:2-dehydro-3-deoxyphosphogluconate aldolase/(4S)-4-hydroxy-2-oxoglutarate aldolase